MFVDGEAMTLVLPFFLLFIVIRNPVNNLFFADFFHPLFSLVIFGSMKILLIYKL